MNTLRQKLDAFMRGMAERADPKVLATLRQAEAALQAAGISEQTLHVGDLAPDFSLPDQFGGTVDLHALCSRGPVVLTFFRGGWCPFCTLSLRSLAEIRPALRKEGADVVAISPQAAGGALETAERNGLTFPVLTDAGNAVARAYGLVWDLSPEVRAVYEKFGHSLPRINATPEWTLPIPAGFVVGPDRRIVYAYADPRADHRMEPVEALSAVRRLKAAA